MVNTYIIVSNKSIHKALFTELKSEVEGNWHFISTPDQLSYDAIKQLAPKYIFFVHWSEKIKEIIFSEFNCVVFHMTDLPYGRGGSPLQNLIVRGHETTILSALKVVEALDAGDIYLKKELKLNGTAQEILERAAGIMRSMIQEIVSTNPKPIPQSGVVELFKRRKPEDGNLSSLTDSKQIYDYIRMLDGEGYPNAFIENEHFKFEFTQGELNADNTISAHVRIIKK